MDEKTISDQIEGFGQGVAKAAEGMTTLQWIGLAVAAYLIYGWYRQNKTTIHETLSSFFSPAAKSADDETPVVVHKLAKLTPRQKRKLFWDDLRRVLEPCIARGDVEGAEDIIEMLRRDAIAEAKANAQDVKEDGRSDPTEHRPAKVAAKEPAKESTTA